MSGTGTVPQPRQRRAVVGLGALALLGCALGAAFSGTTLALPAARAAGHTARRAASSPTTTVAGTLPPASTTVPGTSSSAPVTTASLPATTAPATTTTTTAPPAVTTTTAPIAPPAASTTTYPVVLPMAAGLPGVIQAGGITSDHQIQPTAIILHWWGAVAGSDVYALVGALMGQTGYYLPSLTRAQYLYDEEHGIDGHHLGVQFAVTQDGRMWELTPYANSWAAHAACGNGWAVGIEIEGRGPADLHGDAVQFASVVRLVGELMRLFHIPLGGTVAANGLSGSGVLSHKEVDAHCYFADGSFAGEGKVDVDDAYLAEVRAALAKEGFR